MHGVLELPRSTKQGAAELLSEIEKLERLSEGQAEELLQWFQETPFEPLRCWVGEKAAVLLRDKAPAKVRDAVWNMAEKSEEWPLYFTLIALMNESDSPRFKNLLARASNSQESVIQTFVDELQLRHLRTGDPVH